MSTRAPETPGSPALQRRTEARAQPDWARAARADPDTRYVIASGTTHLVRQEPRAHIAFLDAAQAGVDRIAVSDLLLLGWFGGRRCVLVDLPAGRTLEAPGAHFEELRPLLGRLPADEAELLTYARALGFWRTRHRFCGVCGAATAPRSAGHVLACTNPADGAEFFPRIDPAIIVLVTDGSQALLGRQKSWPAGRYSTLAGFVEPGESLEQAVAREVAEETGTQVHSVRYHASQPWPFPASLMLGFHASARRGAVQLDGELEDARWFEREQLRAAEQVLLPPPFTIARRLIDFWLQQPPHP